MVTLSSSGVIRTWQANRLVFVTSYARSSISSSFSVVGGIKSYSVSEPTTTWQVEHAHSPWHAPAVFHVSPAADEGNKCCLTLYLKLPRFCDVEDGLAIFCADLKLLTIGIHKSDVSQPVDQ